MQRSSWSGAVTMGSFAVPVRQYSSTKDLNNLHPVHTECRKRVQSSTTRHCPHCKKDVEEHEIGRGYRFAPEQYALVPPPVVADIAGIAIEYFTLPHEIDAHYRDEQRWLGPGDDDPSPFITFREALVRSGAVAVCKVRTTGSRTRLAVIEPRGMLLALEVLHFAAELVRPADIPVRDATVTETQINELASQMSRGLRPFDYEAHTDEYRRLIVDTVDQQMRESGIHSSPEAMILEFKRTAADKK